MKQENQNKWETWASELHGEKPQTEINQVIESDEENDWKAVKRIFEIREKAEQIRHLKSGEKAWENIQRKLRPKQAWREFMKYAAAFLISLVITGSAFWAYRAHQYSRTEYANITCPRGQITNVTLFDGTNIWLNAGSTLKYKQSFNQKNREVILEGEALFEVTKNTGKPFIVNANNAQIKVHGTVFDVKAYPGTLKVETVLLEGKVQFSSGSKSVMMQPGEHLVLTTKNGAIAKKKVNTGEYTAWTGGKIYFNNETLANLTRELERWYEVKFQFADEHIKLYHFTGVINKDKSLDYTLKIIQEINKIDFEFKNEQIIIKNAK